MEPVVDATSLEGHLDQVEAGTPPPIAFLPQALTVDDLKSGTVYGLGRPGLTARLAHGDPIVEQSTGQILGHQAFFLVEQGGHPVAELRRGGVTVVEDGHLSWRTLVTVLNSLEIRHYGHPVKFFTKRLFTSARGRLLPDHSRELWFRTAGTDHRVGAYSGPVRY